MCRCRSVCRTVGAEVEAEWAKTPTGEAPRYLHSKASLAKLFEVRAMSAVFITQRNHPAHTSCTNPCPESDMFSTLCHLQQLRCCWIR